MMIIIAFVIIAIIIAILCGIGVAFWKKDNEFAYMMFMIAGVVFIMLLIFASFVTVYMGTTS